MSDNIKEEKSDVLSNTSLYEQQLQSLLHQSVNKDENLNNKLSIIIDNSENQNDTSINKAGDTFITNLSPSLSETDKKEYKLVKNRIVKDIIVPNYYEDVKSTILGRKIYRKASNHAELLSKLLTGAATIVAFAAGAYTDYTYLSFVAGCIGTGAMVSQQFSTYAKGEVKERTEQANKILKIMGIESIPNLEEEN